ncbi:MAG TPA: GH116 family glycosyl hydrolase [Saprospiraceae bacterium]|nr:GH116 family glycosyl hydrolase [Saprospiraceae bacterium]
MKKQNRRKFIRDIGIGGLVTTTAPAVLLAKDRANETASHQDATSNPGKGRNYQGPYTGSHLNRIAFPIGGIGAGMFCLEGGGAISHMSIKNRPDVFNEPGLFGAIYLKGISRGAKILEGPVPEWKKFGQPGAGNGLGGSITGLPHFHHARFTNRFPFADIELKDEELPLEVKITGWSPFIPTDEDRSSLPVGAMEYSFVNTGAQPLDAIFSFNARQFLRIEGGKDSIKSIPGGFILHQEGTSEKPEEEASFAIQTDHPDVIIDHCWFRGGWWDPLTMAWNAIKNGEANAVAPVESGAPGASLYLPMHLEPGKATRITIYFAWYVPQTNITHGKTENDRADCDAGSGCCFSAYEKGLVTGEMPADTDHYQPWYSSKYDSIEAVSNYWLKEYLNLKRDTSLFADAFYSSSLPAEAIEAVACNLSILKSPTVLRQYDGRLWCYEGCGDTWGCCHGSCTHVWNYAQAIPHLFPALERSLRHTEFCENQNAEGHQTFRATLPIRPVDHGFHAAADGQLGGIMKVYRDWRILGEDSWITAMYPMVKQSMDYCIRTWDPDEKGILQEPHHNTYDIEFWGPDGMHATFYLGALAAITAMGKHLGEDVSRYERLSEAARAFTESELYDGEYYIQQIKYTGLHAEDPVKASEKSYGSGYSDEALALLQKEGPKYQYGSGCLSDGVLGAWIARVCGLPDVLSGERLRSHLVAIHKYNLKNDLSDHANPQRPSFALGEEGGLLLCSWPKGGQLSLPFVYSDEVWTGIEHQVASHLMLMGEVDKGLEILQASRDRYDGQVRNPYNEYECGNWYARALSSYGYLQGLTGVRFDAVERTLYVDSKVGDFTSFLSTATGFGTVKLEDGKATVKTYFGTIPVDHTIILAS